MSQKSVLKQVIDCLKEQDVDAYFPGQHKGECVIKYTVVKKEGAVASETVSSERPIYTLMCYVPYNKYSELEDYVNELRTKMKKVFPLVMYVGNETPSYYDESVNGHMISFQYQGCRKIENW